MAEQSGFFDSIDNDRVYASNWLAGYIAAIISNGVYNLELAVIANDNMSVKVEPGRAWINGYFYKNIGDFNLSIDIADGVTHRKDIVVLRFDINKRAINLQVVKGEFSGTPVAPEVTRNAEVYDLELCEISIPAGATKITQSMITDKRLDKNLCGVVHGVVEQIDTTTLLKQMEDWFERFKQSAQGDLDNLEAEFDQWFETIKGKLSEDVAGSLQNQIDTKVSKTGDTMTGELILPNTTPTKTYQAVHKKYVDDNAGKRTCRFVVGTSTAGWTKKDCDYLCDGTDDQVEIQSAINALPSTGGEVVVLDGVYHITASINLNKNNVTLRGCGASTVLKRMWNYSNGISGVIVSNSNYCNIIGFFVDGNKSIYSDSGNYSIRINQNNNFVAENTYNNNSGGGIYSDYCKDNIIRNNKCLNSQHGIRIDGAFTIVIGNTCSNFNKIGISSGSLSDRSSWNNIIANNQCINCDYGISVTGDNLLIIGNTSVRGTGQASDYTSSQQTMQISSSFCLVANNMILGKNYISGVGSNTFVNNKYN